MSKKRTNNKHNKTHNTRLKAKPVKSFNAVRWVKRSFVTLCFLVVIALPLVFYMKQSALEHDLSVLGNGTPTVVQIHDPNCSMCQQLKNNLGSVKGDFKNVIQFKTANIKTPKGRAFASKHQVPHVTLLFFDETGDRVNTLQGVSRPDQIRSALSRLQKGR